ncbi:MAG: S41 family peptidase [Bacteroidota bacterium]
MIKYLFVLAFFFLLMPCHAQQSAVDTAKIREDFNQILQDMTTRYVYLSEKKIDLDCLREKYSAKIDGLQNQSEVILFFEYFLNEFYDSHISLSTNIQESYRLSSPFYVAPSVKGFYIKNVWQSQLSNLTDDIVGAEIIALNGRAFNEQIEAFPSLCQDKKHLEIRTWIANKVLAGKYSEPRILTLRLKSGKEIELDMDRLSYHQSKELLSSAVQEEIGIIRINNSLGNNQLIQAFDKALNDLSETKGLILDLRNTNNGGNTYVAKGIMGRFIDKELPYQKHMYIESYEADMPIVRSWMEMVSPRAKQYTQPLIVLVGRWTGSMGEGMAIGFDAMNRAEIVGTEMKRLAGSDFDFRFSHQSFGYKVILEKLYHIDGRARELYIPKNNVEQSTITLDESMEKAIEILMK